MEPPFGCGADVVVDVHEARPVPFAERDAKAIERRVKAVAGCFDVGLLARPAAIEGELAIGVRQGEQLRGLLGREESCPDLHEIGERPADLDVDAEFGAARECEEQE